MLKTSAWIMKHMSGFFLEKHRSQCKRGKKKVFKVFGSDLGQIHCHRLANAIQKTQFLTFVVLY